MDLIFTPAYAQSAAAPSPGGDLFSILFMLTAFGLIFYLLVFRPQQKRMKEHQDMIQNLRRGDEVMTAGGLLAKVVRVKEGEDEVEVEIADGVRARLVKSTVAAVMSKPEPTKSEGGGGKPARAGAKPGAKSKAKPEREASEEKAEAAAADEAPERAQDAPAEAKKSDDASDAPKS